MFTTTTPVRPALPTTTAANARHRGRQRVSVAVLAFGVVILGGCSLGGTTHRHYYPTPREDAERRAETAVESMPPR